MVPDARRDASAWRGRASVACVVVAGLAMFVVVLGGWIDRSVFDSAEFADRAVVVLRDAATRRALAEAIVEKLEEQGVDEAAALRGALLPLAEDVVGTPGFQEIFRAAIEDAHRIAVGQHAGSATVELGETLRILTSTAAVSNPGLAGEIERRASTLLIDAGPVVDRLHLYRASERVRWLDEAAAGLAIVAVAGALAFDTRRRRAVRRIGTAIVAVGLAVAVVSWIAPRAAAHDIADATLAQAVFDATGRFVSDLTTLGLWVVGFGVLVAAAAVSVGVPKPAVREHVAGWWRDVETTRRGQVIGGVLALVVGGVMLATGGAVVTLALLLLGALLVYVGLVLALAAAFGVPAGSPADRRAMPPARRLVGVVVVALLAVGIAAGAVFAVGAVRGDARADRTLRCNGSAEVCDRRLDQVALAGTHNSMSAATTPGWLFPEQLTGIPTQLERGVRALLVKTHYGTPTGVQIGGAELVVTDVAAESIVNQQEEVSELSAEAVARAEQLEQTVPQQATDRRIYLCHVYCTLGAISLSDVLAELRRFIDRNPGEVIMFFIGNYVSSEDTAAAFEEAQLLDRVWTYDTSRPPPTLREMIAARRTLLVLVEHDGGQPAWYTNGYGIFQDTPFTFATPQQFSCRHNRGPADASLFELNHFITTDRPPSIDTAREVNSYPVLMGRVRECTQQRGLLPNIIAVNFYDEGDLLGVVADVNAGADPLPSTEGGTTVPAAATTAATTSSDAPSTSGP